MTFNIGTIQGGTNAGWRKIVELKDWVCCGPVKRYHNQCPTCGARRV